MLTTDVDRKRTAKELSPRCDGLTGQFEKLFGRPLEAHPFHGNYRRTSLLIWMNRVLKNPHYSCGIRAASLHCWMIGFAYKIASLTPQGVRRFRSDFEKESALKDSALEDERKLLRQAIINDFDSFPRRKRQKKTLGRLFEEGVGSKVAWMRALHIGPTKLDSLIESEGVVPYRTGESNTQWITAEDGRKIVEALRLRPTNKPNIVSSHEHNPGESAGEP